MMFSHTITVIGELFLLFGTNILIVSIVLSSFNIKNTKVVLSFEIFSNIIPFLLLYLNLITLL
jgi:hypothetical protein